MSNLFTIEDVIYIQNDGTVGLGISNPSKKLEVIGDIDTTTDYNINGTQVLSATTLGSGVVNSSLTSVGTLSSLDVTGNVDVDGTFDSQGAATFQTTATVNDDFFVGPGSGQSTNTLYVDKGSNLVNISGEFDIWGKLRVDSNATYVETGILSLTDSLSGALLDTGGSNIRLTPNISNVGALEIDSSGNTSLTGDLSVSGSSEITGFLDVKSTSTTTPLLSLRSGNGNVAFNDGAQIQFGYGGNQQYNHFIHTRHNSSDSNNAIDFYLCDGTESNTLTSGSNHCMSLNSGNVGIGTTDPDVELHVRKDQNAMTQIECENIGTGTGACARILAQSASGAMYIEAFDDDFTTSGARIADSGLLSTGTGNSGGLGIRSYAGDIHFWSGGNNERMRIDSSGNVGIGTSTPEGLLDVKVRPDTDYYASYKDIYLGSYLSIGYQRYSNIPYIGYNARLYTSIVDTSGDAYTSNGNQNGNFFKPSYAGASASTMRIQGGSHDGTMWWKHYNHGTNSDQVNEGSFTTDMYMDKDGNLGLGTTTPLRKLDVDGTFKVRGNDGFSGAVCVYNCERNGNHTTSSGSHNKQMAWGNGSSATHGITMPKNGTVLGLTFSASANSSCQLHLTDNNAETGDYITATSTTSTNIAEGMHNFSAGDRIGMKLKIISGTTSNVCGSFIVRFD